MKSLITLILIVMTSTKAFAAEGPPFRLSVGFGEVLKYNIRYQNQYYRGKKDLNFTTIPFVNLHYGPIMIASGGLTVSAWGDRDKSVYFNINRQGDRYYGIGMDKRSDSWFFGFGFKYYNFNFITTKDINGKSGGRKTALSYSEMKMLENKNILRGSVALELYDQKYAEYYYGVKSTEVSTNRSEYHPDRYVQLALSGLFIHNFNDNINGTVGLAFKSIPKAMKDSPTTTNADLESMLITGISWVFY